MMMQNIGAVPQHQEVYFRLEKRSPWTYSSFADAVFVAKAYSLTG
jgi:hypothetical protein